LGISAHQNKKYVHKNVTKRNKSDKKKEDFYESSKMTMDDLG
jgi:hypothetical protein